MCAVGIPQARESPDQLVRLTTTLTGLRPARIDQCENDTLRLSAVDIVERFPEVLRPLADCYFGITRMRESRTQHATSIAPADCRGELLARNGINQFAFGRNSAKFGTACLRINGYIEGAIRCVDLGDSDSEPRNPGPGSLTT